MKNIKLFQEILKCAFLNLLPKLSSKMKLRPNQTLFDRTHSNMKSSFSYQKILYYINDFQNRNFPVLWLKWTQTMKVKQNQTFFHGIYLSSVEHIQTWRNSFLSKCIKVFQWLLKSKFLSFITKVNPNNWNETKSDIFPWNKFKSDIIFHWSQKKKKN